MDPTEYHNKIAALERRAAHLRPIVEQQEFEEYDPDTDGCESCFDSRTEEMMELELVESQIDSWKIDLSFLELYLTLSPAAKEDEDVATIWWNVRRKFSNAATLRLTGASDYVLTQAAVRALTSAKAEVRAFARGLVDAQNRVPLGRAHIMPREFMQDVVRLGLMEASRIMDNAVNVT